MADEQQIQEAPPQDPPRKQLWKGLKDRGLYSRPYEDFEKKYSSPDSIKMLYDGMKQRNLYSKSLTDFNGKYFSDTSAIKWNQKAAPQPEQQAAAPPPTPPVRSDLTAASFASSPQDVIRTGLNMPEREKSDIEKIDNRGRQAETRIIDELKKSDNAVGTIVARSTREAWANEMQQLASSSDPAAPQRMQQLQAAIIGKMFDDSDEKIYKSDLLQNPAKIRQVLHQIKTSEPEKKAQIESDLYIHDIQNIVTPQNAKRVQKNVSKIEKGEYEYDVKNGQLQVPLGTIDAMVKGWRERKGELDKFATYQKLKGAAGDDWLRQQFDEERKAHDPLEPVPTAKGFWPTAGEMAGKEGIPLAKGVVPAVVGGYFGAPQAGAAVGAVLNADEFAARTFVTSTQQSYYELLDKGMNPQEAFARAKSQGIVDAAKAAVQAGVAAYVGAKTALPVKAVKWSPGYQKIIGNVLKDSKEFLKSIPRNSLPAAGVVGGTEIASNVIAQQSGFDRQAWSNVPEAVGAQLMLEVGIGGLAKGFHLGYKSVKALTSRETNIVLQNIAKQPDAEINQALHNVATEQNLAPEQVQAVQDQITAQRQKDARIPPEVTDEDTRVLLHEKLDEYDNIQLKLKGGEGGEGKVSDAFKGELKDRATDLEFDIQVLKSKPKEQVKMIKDKQAELEANIEKVAEKNKEGKVATAEEKQQVLKDRSRIKELDKQLQEAETRAQKPEPLVSVIRPNENAPRETITIKPKENAISEQEPTTVDVRQPSDNGAPMGEGNPEYQGTTGKEAQNTPQEEGVVADLSQEPELPPSTKVPLNKDSRQPFTTKSGRQTVHTDESGKLVVKNKEGGDVDPKTRRKAINEYIDEFDFTHGETANLEGLQLHEADKANRHIAETSNNPQELATVFANEEPSAANLSTKEKFIAEFGIGKVNPETFDIAGDPNHLTPRIRKKYFPDPKKVDLHKRGGKVDLRELGEDLDEIARQMSDHYNIEITPKDVADFMIRFPEGEAAALKGIQSETALLAAQRFEELTGIKLNFDTAERVINKEFNKLDKAQQALLTENGTAEKIYNDFWDSFDFEGEEANRTAAESNAGEAGQVAEGGGNTRNSESEAGADVGAPPPPEPPKTETSPAGDGRGELDKMSATIPNEGVLREYGSKGTIEKYHNETPLNDQEIFVQELLPALEHGEKIIEKAREVFGNDYVEKTLDYIADSKARIQSKALMYISLENALAREKQANPGNLGIQKQQDLVRAKSQAFLRETSLAVNFGKLRRIGEFGFDVTQVTDKFYTTKELEAKTKLEEAMQADADKINAQAEEDVLRNEVDAPELERRIEEGVAAEIEKINKALSPDRKSYANKAIDALEKIQKKIRSKGYSDATGAVAFIDAGITTIKNAIKAGIAVSKAVELGIAKIKEKMGNKPWPKEDEFRKDMLDGFAASGVAAQHSVHQKSIAEQTLIDNGFGREINVKTANGTEKRKVLDWKKLAGAEGSVDKIKQHVEEALEKGGMSKADIDQMQKELVTQYNAIRQSVIEKSITELNRRNKVAATPEQKSAAKKLSELYNYGLLDQNPTAYEEALSKAVGIKNFDKVRYEKVKDLAEAMAKVYSTKVDGRHLTDVELKSVVQDLEEKIRIVLREEATNHGSLALKLADYVRTWMDASQRMMLGTLKQIIENPFSGISQNVISGIEETAGGKSTTALRQRKRAHAGDVFKNIVAEGGVGYGNVNTTFVNKGSLDTYINKIGSKGAKTVLNTIIGKAHLDAADAFFKAKLTEQNFTHNLLKILQRERTVDGKTLPAMSKDEALHYVSEKLTGQSFENAKKTAQDIIGKVNATKKIVGDSPSHVNRLANDIVKAALISGSKVSVEHVTASYNAGYKAAGRSLGHEANNFISQMVQGTTGKIEKAINDAIKEKEYTRAAALTLQSVFFRNIANPFVGGGTNWIVLKLEKNGLGLVTGLGQKIGGKKIDLSTEAGMKNLQKALYDETKAKDAIMRGMVGAATTGLLSLGVAGAIGVDDLRKWREENPAFKKYADLFTPEPLLALMYARDEKLGNYLNQLFNKNESYSESTKLIKGTVKYFQEGKKDEGAGLGLLGQGFGGSFGVPLPWRLARDGQSLWLGAHGKDPYKVDWKATDFMEGALKNGMIEYIRWNLNNQQHPQQPGGGAGASGDYGRGRSRERKREKRSR